MSLPDAFLDEMKALLGKGYGSFLASYDDAARSGVMRNPIRLTTEAFERASPFPVEPIPGVPGGFYVDAATKVGLHQYHEAGVYYAQEPSAMSAPAMLGVKNGERVLDLCAAPGGKAWQLCAAAGAEGFFCANEAVPKRAGVLCENLERMGLGRALVLCEYPEKLTGVFEGFFDKILVDAPCSGEGMFRREPAARAQWSENAPAGCARRQMGILAAAANMLAPGGRLLYSTCTFNEVENEGVARGFLAAHPDFSPKDFALPGLGQSENGMLRVMPHRARGDGQFAALFVKAGTAPRRGAQIAPSRAAREALARYLEEYTDFPEGSIPLLWGDALYAAPAHMPPIDGLRVIAPGLGLAKMLPKRLEPLHALAMAGKNLPTANLDEQAALAYLRGEPVAHGGAGWLVAMYRGMPLGWGKASGGVLKNHLPKGLRGSLRAAPQEP